jgi:hypothetical protein
MSQHEFYHGPTMSLLDGGQREDSEEQRVRTVGK